MEDKVCLNSDNLSESRILSMIEDYVCNRFMFEQHNFKTGIISYIPNNGIDWIDTKEIHGMSSFEELTNIIKT